MPYEEMLVGYGDVLSPEDLQHILHVGRNTIYKYLSAGTIKSIRIGSMYRIPKQYLIDFLFPKTAVSVKGGT